MPRVTDNAPYYTTFRRKVRRLLMPVSVDAPYSLVQESTRRQLNEAKHTVVENSWDDRTGADDYMRPARVVSVRYVTGGMRHGLGSSIELQPQVGEIEFTRPHGPGFSRWRRTRRA